MTLKLNGTNSEAAPAYAGDDADTGLQCGTNELKLVTGGTARATVDSSGRLLLGTTTEGYSVADNLTIADSSECGMTIRSGTSSSGSIYFSDATSGAGEYDGYIEYSQSSRYMRFGTAQNERLRILSSGGLTFNGDTAAANALDDYEEGDWNITNAGDSTGVINSSHCKYTKIGRVVVCHFVITVSVNFSSSSLAGLPFNPANVAGSPSGVHSLIPVRSAGSGSFFFQINSGTDTISTLANSSGGTLATLSTSTDPYRGTFTYQI